MARNTKTPWDIERTYIPGHYAVAGLTALAIVLKLRFFEIPYPAFPALKYDLSGVPLAVVAYFSLKSYIVSLLVFFIVNITWADPIGMIMKVLAEASTGIPLAIIARKRREQRVWELTGILVSTLSRIALMTILNLLVTPHWLLMAKWAKNYGEAFTFTLMIIPHVVLFNASLGVIVSTIALAAIRVLRKAGYLK